MKEAPGNLSPIFGTHKGEWKICPVCKHEVKPGMEMGKVGSTVYHVQHTPK
jgi:hypothetical protein